MSNHIDPDPDCDTNAKESEWSRDDLSAVMETTTTTTTAPTTAASTATMAMLESTDLGERSPPPPLHPHLHAHKEHDHLHRTHLLQQEADGNDERDVDNAHLQHQGRGGDEGARNGDADVDAGGTHPDPDDHHHPIDQEHQEPLQAEGALDGHSKDIQ